MLSKQDRIRQKEDYQLFQEWMAGSHEKPFKLTHRENYHACSVILHTPALEIGFNLRHLLMFLISRIAWSPLKIFFFRLMGVKIGKNVYIAPWVVLDAMFPSLIELQDNCFLGVGCVLITHEYTTTGFRIGRVRIGAGTVIGAFTIIRSQVSIGRAVNTGLGSVVFHDIPDGMTAIGNPARYETKTKVTCEV
jgi:acetyltransferase-like isoleucine patch superfamily enzyme